MRLFKLRNKAHQLGFQILEHGTGWEVTNGGVKKELSWVMNTLEEVEEHLISLKKEEDNG